MTSNKLKFNASSVLEKEDRNKTSLFNFIRHQVGLLREAGRHRTAAHYVQTLNSLMHYREGCDLPFCFSLRSIYEVSPPSTLPFCARRTSARVASSTPAARQGADASPNRARHSAHPRQIRRHPHLPIPPASYPTRGRHRAAAVPQQYTGHQPPLETALGLPPSFHSLDLLRGTPQLGEHCPNGECHYGCAGTAENPLTPYHRQEDRLGIIVEI